MAEGWETSDVDETSKNWVSFKVDTEGSTTGKTKASIGLISNGLNIESSLNSLEVRSVKCDESQSPKIMQCNISDELAG